MLCVTHFVSIMQYEIFACSNFVNWLWYIHVYMQRIIELVWPVATIYFIDVQYNEKRTSFESKYNLESSGRLCRYMYRHNYALSYWSEYWVGVENSFGENPKWYLYLKVCHSQRNMQHWDHKALKDDHLQMVKCQICKSIPIRNCTQEDRS